MSQFFQKNLLIRENTGFSPKRWYSSVEQELPFSLSLCIYFFSFQRTEWCYLSRISGSYVYTPEKMTLFFYILNSKNELLVQILIFQDCLCLWLISLNLMDLTGSTEITHGLTLFVFLLFFYFERTLLLG